MTYLPMGKNRKERALEKKLMKMGWKRASHQHYAKMVKGQEVAIDEHIGHFCVGIYRNNRAVGENEAPNGSSRPAPQRSPGRKTIRLKACLGDFEIAGKINAELRGGRLIEVSLQNGIR